jgi:hypothetical protein
MGFAKWLGRRGDVATTARWVANGCTLACFPVGILVLVVPLLACGVLNPESPHPIEGVDYGAAPTDNDLRMVERDLRFAHDLEMTGYCKEAFGPLRGSLELDRDGRVETVYGYEYHCRWTDDEHYMVFIRDGEVLVSESCGKTDGFPLLSRPSCYGR